MKRVEAFQYTHAASTKSTKRRAASGFSVTMASEWRVPWQLMWAMASSTPSTTFTE